MAKTRLRVAFYANHPQIAWHLMWGRMEGETHRQTETQREKERETEVAVYQPSINNSRRALMSANVCQNVDSLIEQKIYM